MVKPFYKPLDRPEREEIWYCYYVPDRKKQDSSPPQKIPISQVPDLTKETARGSFDLQKNENVGRVLETDSNYVKLAKTGGRKNLLCYRENERKNSGPKAYKVPEWYYHNDKEGKEAKELSEEEMHKRYKVTYGKRSYKALEKPKTYERPDYMMHLEAEELTASFGVSDRIPDRPIFGFDSFSYWKRDELEKSDILPSLVPSMVEQRNKKAGRDFVSKEDQGKKKFKLPTQSKKQMSRHRKLASSDYAIKWHEKWYIQAVRK